jgi:IclR family mhp operon transcriptional activator
MRRIASDPMEVRAMIQQSSLADAAARSQSQRRLELENRSLLKGLRIIEAINQRPGMILAQITVLCGLPRTTAHRALRTLEQNGFVWRDEATSRYFPHRRVLGLSSGFDPLARTTALVREQFAEVGPKVGWPLHFAVPSTELQSPQMNIQASTDYTSPLAVDKLLPGRSIPLLQCAAGLAWLATQPQAARAPIIERAINDRYERTAQTRWTARTLEEKLDQVRRCGYADFYWPERHTNMVGLSVPVNVADHSSAALTIRFAESAVPVKEAVARFLPMLRVVAMRVDALAGGKSANAIGA